MFNEIRIARELSCPFCVFALSRFSFGLGIITRHFANTGSAPRAAVEISPKDSGGLRDLTLFPLVLEWYAVERGGHSDFKTAQNNAVAWGIFSDESTVIVDKKFSTLEGHEAELGKLNVRE